MGTSVQKRDIYARSLEGKRVAQDGENNIKHIWEQGKQAIIESAREVCGSVRIGRKNPKSIWWNNKVKAIVKTKENAWKISGVRDEDAKGRCLDVYKNKDKG